MIVGRRAVTRKYPGPKVLRPAGHRYRPETIPDPERRPRLSIPEAATNRQSGIQPQQEENQTPLPQASKRFSFFASFCPLFSSI